MFKYIISGNGYKALAVHSSLNWIEFKEYVRSRSERIHPEGTDTVFKWGVLEFVNPKVFGVEEFADYLPAIIEISYKKKRKTK